MTGPAVILVTADSEAHALSISKHLIENRLAACASIVPKIRSIYMWEDTICDEEEFLLIIKTRGDLFERVRDAIVEMHNYSVPEIVSLPIVEGLEEYLAWINDVTVV
ncbi:MAG: divalent-cation tolerance protein CutA [Deltaproteobacteria bacterium]|nr:divalent-cation tolerance protein CutA [Candidatus Zymogenaceae bacterium]